VHCRKILLPLNSVLPTFFSTPMQILITIEKLLQMIGKCSSKWGGVSKI
jgi:hypothetical protein